MRMLIIAVAILTGCVNGNNQETDQSTTRSNNVSYLCVGMEYSSRFGECPGCERDATRLSSLMKEKYGYKGEVLISEEATKSAVVSKMKKYVAATGEDGLFLFFYSGHGGQEYLGYDEPEGADDKDEYLCLYDYAMLDDEIWAIISQCRGRVFLYFDACHSATMYRSVSSELKLAAKTAFTNEPVAVALSLDQGDLIQSSGFTFKPENFVTATPMSDESSQNVRMLCWSGCKEAEYSYGSSLGGTLTSAVIAKWKKGATYGALWEDVRSRVIREQPTQNPVQTFIGDGFTEEMEAFK